MFSYRWGHQWTMCCFLNLRHFSGERTNQIMRSITVIIMAIHLQEEDILCDWWSVFIGCFKQWCLEVGGTFRGLSRSLEQNVCKGTVNFFQVGFRLFFTTLIQTCIDIHLHHYHKMHDIIMIILYCVSPGKTIKVMIFFHENVANLSS